MINAYLRITFSDKSSKCPYIADENLNIVNRVDRINLLHFLQLGLNTHRSGFPLSENKLDKSDKLRPTILQ